MSCVQERRRAPATIALTGLAGLAVAMGIGRFAFTPILPMMQEDAGLSVADGGWLAAANYVGYLLGALSAIAIRVPATTAIRSGLIGIGIMTLAMGFTGSFAAWIALRSVAGVASAWVMISISSWCLGRLAPLRLPLLNGAVFAGVGLGITVAGLVCLLLMYSNAGSAAAWIGLGILSLAAAAMTWRVVGSELESPPHVTDATRRHHDGWNAESIRLVLCYGAFGFGYIIPATFVPAMAREAIPDAWVFGWAWPVFGVAAAASTLGASAAGIGGNRRLWMLSQLVMAVAVALPVFVAGISGIILAAVGVGGTFMVNTMAGMQEARAVAGPHATGLMAAMTSAFAVGQIGGPIVVSHVVTVDGGFSVGLLLASALLTASAYVLWRYPALPPTARGRDT